MIQIEARDGDVVELSVDGRILHEDYQRIIPRFEEIIHTHGSMRCLIEIRHVTGIQPRAIVDDIAFDLKHARQIRKCAVVTEAGWQQWMSKLGRVFMPRCEIRGFSPEDRAEAAAWVRA